MLSWVSRYKQTPDGNSRPGLLIDREVRSGHLNWLLGVVANQLFGGLVGLRLLLILLDGRTIGQDCDGAVGDGNLDVMLGGPLQVTLIGRDRVGDTLGIWVEVLAGIAVVGVDPQHLTCRREENPGLGRGAQLVGVVLHGLGVDLGDLHRGTLDAEPDAVLLLGLDFDLFLRLRLRLCLGHMTTPKNGG